MSTSKAARRLIDLAKAAYEQAMLDDSALPEGPDSWEKQPDEVKSRWVNVVLVILQENRRLREPKEKL
jgi:hypothetical protein